MLIFSEEHYVPTDINMMVLKGRNDEGYFYIHRMLYDQAVILNDIYGDDPKNLIMAITNKTDSRADVDYFLEHAPVPINIFGPYLLLVKEEITDFIDMIGAIHVMSTSSPSPLRKSTSLHGIVGSFLTRNLMRLRQTSMLSAHLCQAQL